MRKIVSVVGCIWTLLVTASVSCSPVEAPSSSEYVAPQSLVAVAPSVTRTTTRNSTTSTPSPPWWPQTTKPESREDIFLERHPLAGIEDILVVGEDGALAVRLANSPDDLHLLDPQTGKVTFIAQPPDGSHTKDPAILAFGVSPNWVGWISRPDTHDRGAWLLLVRERASGQDIIVARPDPTIREEYPNFDTYPYPSLSGDLIVWASYERDQRDQVMKTIRLKHLPDGPCEVLASLPSTTDWQVEYITMPEVCENAVVWFKGRRDFENSVLFADTYLYNLRSRTTLKLNSDTHASIPRVNRSHVVWVERSTEMKRVRGDIIAYDRSAEQTMRLNPEGDAGREWENYNPSLGSRFVTWWNSRHDAFPLYDLREQRLEYIEGGGFAIVNGSYLVWRDLATTGASGNSQYPLHWWVKLPE